MGGLEQRLATYMVRSSMALQPSDARLAGSMPHTRRQYILEDDYLNALAAGLSNGDLSGLLDTAIRAAGPPSSRGASSSRFLAQQLSLVLPGDLQQPDGAEIAPSVSGISLGRGGGLVRGW